MDQQALSASSSISFSPSSPLLPKLSSPQLQFSLAQVSMPFDKARTAVQGNASPLIPVHAAESHSHRDGSATAAAQSDAQGQVPVQSRYNPVESAKAKHLCLQLQTRLRYAKLKIDYGWQTQGLEEVENLWTHAQPKPKTASGGGTRRENGRRRRLLLRQGGNPRT